MLTHAIYPYCLALIVRHIFLQGKTESQFYSIIQFAAY